MAKYSTIRDFCREKKIRRYHRDYQPKPCCRGIEEKRRRRGLRDKRHREERDCQERSRGRTEAPPLGKEAQKTKRICRQKDRRESPENKRMRRLERILSLEAGRSAQSRRSGYAGRNRTETPSWRRKPNRRDRALVSPIREKRRLTTTVREKPDPASGQQNKQWASFLAEWKRQDMRGRIFRTRCTCRTPEPVVGNPPNQLSMKVHLSNKRQRRPRTRYTCRTMRDERMSVSSPCS